MPHIFGKLRLGPVVAVAVYRNDVLVMRQGDALPGHPYHVRNEIYELSADSLRRLAFVANNADTEFSSMVTLTYPAEFPPDGFTVKRHLHLFLYYFQSRFKNSLYLWVLEFQRRGAPHLHIFVNVALPDEPGWRKLEYAWLSYIWYDIVGSGDRKHLAAGTRWEDIREPEGARHYVVKYAAKKWQKAVPPEFRQVGRFWGCSRSLSITPKNILAVDEDEIRQYLAGWPYLEHIKSFMPKVLYNAARFWRK